MRRLTHSWILLALLTLYPGRSVYIAAFIVPNGPISGLFLILYVCVLLVPASVCFGAVFIVFGRSNVLLSLWYSTEKTVF